MKKGLDILAKGNVIEAPDQMLSADSQKQKEDLFSEFFANASMTPEDAQKRFADIIASAE
jgi:glucose/mannose transport system substrate-binding protein